MAESNGLQDRVQFLSGGGGSVGMHYHRAPNKEDTAWILAQNAARGFSCIVGSIDCMHLESAVSCLKLRLTTVCGVVIPFWHGWINVIQRSPVFGKLVEGHAPTITYEINGNTYIKGYYLPDGIYPPWVTFPITYGSPPLLLRRWTDFHSA
jgi:hypothetical protein